MVCVPTLRLLVVKLVWPPPFTAVGPARVVPGLEQVPPSMKLTLPSVTAVLSDFVTVAVSVTEVWNLELAGAAPSVVAVPAGAPVVAPPPGRGPAATARGPPPGAPRALVFARAPGAGALPGPARAAEPP